LQRDYKNFKKELGQNFLRNQEVVLDMIEALEPLPEDVVLEIGPGTGALTQYIISSVKHIVLVEFDNELVQRLTETYAMYPNVTLIHGDILLQDLKAIQKDFGVNKVIGALPYNISKKIVMNVSGQPDLVFQRAVFMLQKEVAFEYLPAVKKHSLLENYFSQMNDITHVVTAEKSSFVPVPKVDSAAIRMDRKPVAEIELKSDEFQNYYTFLQKIFNNPRKKLTKNLKTYYSKYNWEEYYKQVGFKPEIRIEELLPAQVLVIFRFVHAA